jgi:hypothetical protein
MKKRDVMRDSRPRELLLAVGAGTGKGGVFKKTVTSLVRNFQMGGALPR